MAQNSLGYNQVFPIYDENGHPFHNLSLKKSTLELTGMNLGDKITGDVMYNGTLTFTMREYIEYKSNPNDENEEPVRFILINPPTQTRNGLVKDASSDAGMTKYTFVFYHPMALLSGFDFNDVAVSDDEKQYLSESRTFSWIGKIPDYCRKLNKNLESTEWVCYVGSSVDEATLNKLSEVLPFDNATIADALKTFYDTWKVPYVVDSITGTGQYIDPITGDDYYTLGKRFVIILGYPSNEIMTTKVTSYECTEPWQGLYRYPRTITIKAGTTANVPSWPMGALYLTSGTPINLPYTPDVDTNVYVVCPYTQSVAVNVDEPYIFQFGQGLGLKNNSRTPKNNKIVTRIVGYGSEDNIPYGYPQIRWYGDQRWEYTKYVGEVEYDEDNKPINAPAPDAYPLYMGILGGQYVKLIKHPFTRNHLMPSVYRETLFNKISPYNADGSVNTEYDPDITLIDYYDADITFPNPCDPTAPSVEIHQFEDVKPELGEERIVNAFAYWRDDEKHPWYTVDGYKTYMTNLKNTLSSALQGDKLIVLAEMMMDYNFDAQDSDTELLVYEGDINDPQYYVQFQPNPTSTPYFWHMDATIKYRLQEETSPNAKSWVLHEEVLSIDVLRSDAAGEPPTEWDDTMDDDGKYVQNYFKMTLPQLPFDLYACASITQEMKINMRSGACIGCTFNVSVDWEDYKRNFYKSDGTFDPVIGEGHPRNGDKYPDTRNGQVTLIVQKDNETFGTLMPNVYQQPKGTAQVEQEEDADKFVILGISLPEEYITNPDAGTLEERGAEEVLTDDMLEYMLENNVHYYEYPLQMDEDFLCKHLDILSQFKQNAIFRFAFNGANNALYVKQMSIKFGDGVLPKYDITLADDIEIVLNQIGQTVEDVSRIRVQMNELQKYYGENLAAEIAEKLSKIADDVAMGRITFQRGLESAGSIIANDEIRSSSFVTGMDTTGMGWRIDKNGNAELESLKVRSFLQVVELMVNRLQAQEGDTIFSDNDQVDYCQRYADESNLNEFYHIVLKDKWEGYYTAQRKGNILRGIINTLAAKQSGVSNKEGQPGQQGELGRQFYTSWMRVLYAYADSSREGMFSSQTNYSVGNAVNYEQAEGTELYVFIKPHYGQWNDDDVIKIEPNALVVVLYNGNDVPQGYNFEPCPMMTISRWGCVDDGSLTQEELDRRQRSFYISTTDGRITKLRGVDSPKLTEENYGTTLGILPDFIRTEWTTIANRLIDGRDYLYAQGVVVGDFIKVDIQGNPLVTYVDCGEWDATKTYLHEQYNEDTLQYETSDVWYNGSYWRNQTPDNINHEPTSTSSDWVKLMHSGDSAPEYESASYAWSNTVSTANVTTEPVVDSWETNIPDNTQGRTYLWQRIIKWRLVNGTYVPDAARYIRLNGANGTSIDIKGTVTCIVSSPPNFPTNASEGDYGLLAQSPTLWVYHNNVWAQSTIVAADGDSYTMSKSQTWGGEDVKGHLFMWSNEKADWLDLGQFQGQNGITYYTHIAWAKGDETQYVNPTITPIAGQTYSWWGVYVDTNPTDSQVWSRYKWNYIKGEAGTSVLAEYSEDGISDWHTPFSVDDKYMHTSSDGGLTWGEAMQIVGENGSNGDYTDYQFARSADKVIPQGQTAPTIDGQWRDAPVATTETYPYLWSKVVQVSWNGDTPVYGTPKYIRLNGEDGYNTAELVLYQRATSTPVNKPNTLTYNFGTNELRGETWNGWSRAMPSSNGTPCYTIQALVSSKDVETQITPNMWGSATKLVEDGQRGKTGKNYYYLDKWENISDSRTFDVTDYETPYVEYRSNAEADYVKWVFVGANGTYTKAQAGLPTNINPNWEIMVTDFKYLISKAVFADWARLGEWVFNGDYMFSNDGVDAQGNATSFDDNKVFYGFDDARNTYTPNTVLDSQTGKVLFGAGKATFNPDGSGWLARQNIQWEQDGSCAFKGGMRSPFTQIAAGTQTSALSDYSDNVAALALSEETPTPYQLDWDVTQSGRRLTLIDYQWVNEGGQGRVYIDVPTGSAYDNMWFYEDGRRKKRLVISREGVVLLGYGTPSEFYGWIVLNRFDIMTLSKYGHTMKQLVCVHTYIAGEEAGVTTYSADYGTFDGRLLGFSRQGTGHYRITWGNNEWFRGKREILIQATPECNPSHHYLTISVEVLTNDNNVPTGVDVYIGDALGNTAMDSTFSLTVSNASDMMTMMPLS